MHVATSKNGRELSGKTIISYTGLWAGLLHILVFCSLVLWPLIISCRYGGEDKLYDVIAAADHNSVRPRNYMKKIADFLRAALQCESGDMVVACEPTDQEVLEFNAVPPGFKAVDSRSRPGIAYFTTD